MAAARLVNSGTAPPTSFDMVDLDPEVNLCALWQSYPGAFPSSNIFTVSCPGNK